MVCISVSSLFYKLVDAIILDLLLDYKQNSEFILNKQRLLIRL